MLKWFQAENVALSEFNNAVQERRGGPADEQCDPGSLGSKDEASPENERGKKYYLA